MIKFHKVPHGHCVIIERLGKYARTQKAGLRFYIPGLERIKRLDIEGSHWGDAANKENYLIELSEQNTSTHGSKAYTQDNVEITVDASIFWQIIDAKKAVYESDSLPLSIRDRALGVLRSSIGLFSFDELSTHREQLSRDTTDALIESGKKWGVKFTRVEIQQLLTDGKTHEALLQQVHADRRKKAIIAEAQGNSEQTQLNAEAKKKEAILAAEAEELVQVLRARGKREALALESEGKAQQIRNIAQAQAEALSLVKNSEMEYLREMSAIVGPADAASLLLAQKYIEGFEMISKNPSDKVFLPNNFAAAFNINTDRAAYRETPVASRDTPVVPRETTVVPRETPVVPRETPVVPRETPVVPRETPVVPTVAPRPKITPPVAPEADLEKLKLPPVQLSSKPVEEKVDILKDSQEKTSITLEPLVAPEDNGSGKAI